MNFNEEKTLRSFIKQKYKLKTKVKKYINLLPRDNTHWNYIIKNRKSHNRDTRDNRELRS
jgi:hypothetical protein